MELDGRFRTKQPDPDDRIMTFEGRYVLAIKADDGIRLPTVAEVADSMPRLHLEAIYGFVIHGPKGAPVGSGTGSYFIGLRPMGTSLSQMLESNSQDGFGLSDVMELASSGRRVERFAAATGKHLHNWYDTNRVCGRCGHPMARSELERCLICPECSNMVFPRINPVVAVAVTDGERILLTRYAGRHYRQRSIVAGFCEIGETPEQACAREVFEETGLQVKDIVYRKSQPWGVDGNIMMGFSAVLDGSEEVTIDDNELSSAEWVERSEITETDDDMSLTRSLVIDFKEGRF